MVINLKAAKALGLDAPDKYSRLRTRRSSETPGVHQS
jgi:hypothetical protein